MIDKLILSIMQILKKVLGWVEPVPSLDNIVEVEFKTPTDGVIQPVEPVLPETVHILPISIQKYCCFFQIFLSIESRIEHVLH